MSNFISKFLMGQWNVGIIEKSVEDIVRKRESYEIRWMKHHYADRFFADPFLWKTDESFYYIFAEEMPFYCNIGYISLLKIRRKDMKLVEKQKIISDDSHFSYPNPVGEWIIPENFRSGKCEAYRFDGEKIKEKKLIMAQGLIDQTFLTYGGKEWIFATDEDNKLCGLKIYYRGAGSNESWKEHTRNPVSEDIYTARPGGHFFKIGDKLYRPGQDSKIRYGHKIHIMEVTELTETNYAEKEVCILDAEGQGRYHMGLHTFNAEDGFIVVDGFREYHSWFVKPMCLKFPNIMKRLEK